MVGLQRRRREQSERMLLRRRTCPLRFLPRVVRIIIIWWHEASHGCCICSPYLNSVRRKFIMLIIYTLGYYISVYIYIIYKNTYENHARHKILLHRDRIHHTLAPHGPQSHPSLTKLLPQTEAQQVVYIY